LQKYRIVFLVAFVLGVFYPAVFAEISIVDDAGAIDSFLNSDAYSIRAIFVPNTASGGYYRPFIGVSYLLDKLIWLFDPKAMHLENILMHCLNIVLVYFLALTLLERDNKNGSLVPLTASLLFGVHPIVTESVNWISGRTDLMAANFILLCMILVIKYFKKKSIIVIIASILLFMGAVFSKEISLGFLPALFIFVVARKGSFWLNNKECVVFAPAEMITFLIFVSVSVLEVLFIGNYWFVIVMGIIYCFTSIYQTHHRNGERIVAVDYAKYLVFTVASLSAAIGLFWGVRRLVYTSDIDKISMTLKLIFDDTNYAISVFFRAIAFYVKKFFLPLPLNFYIREIDPLYSLVGIIIFFVCLALFRKLTKASVLFIAGICMVLPALPFAFGTIAWTPYAERYIYIATAFWSLSMSLLGADLIRLFYEKYDSLRFALAIKLTVLFLLLLMSMVTFQRNLKWMTNIGIIGDTVSQSPESKTLRSFYMVAYCNKNDFAAAKNQYHIANSLYSLQYDETLDVNMAGILAAEADFKEAERYYLIALNKTKWRSALSLNAYFNFICDDKALDALGINNDERRLARRIDIGKKLYGLNKDPIVFYRLGQLAVSSYQYSEAISFFSKAANELPAANVYRDYSLRIISKLEKKSGL